MKKKKQQKPVCVGGLEQESLSLLKKIQEEKQQLEDYYPRLLTENLTDEGEQRAESLKRASANMARAGKQVYAIQDELRGRVQDVKLQNRKNKLVRAPANAAIDLEEAERNHFARGINCYKLLLVCFMGSLCGVIVEMLWCLLTRGYLESRAGLVYGPFNLLYGFGAVLLTVCLYRFRDRGAWVSFLGGIVVGSVVEYVCSWGQEFVFGSRSWDYSNMPFNINGRICLLYSVFWGMLAVLWIKNLYPRLSKWILRIPNRAGKILTWVLAAFFLINTVMSGLALTRWSQRNAGIAPKNGFWQLIDERFPDERMERVYANMVFPE